jgi:prepilin-type N-terminal cleavage/methylation domain-containing protein
MGPRSSRAPALARAAGFTLIELLVVVSIVAVVFGVGLDRLLRYQELGERTAMEQNVAAINVALTMKFAALVSGGRGESIEAEVGTNPVDLLARPPENYLGELFAPSVASLPQRSWHYDRQSRELVYVPGRTRYLTSGGQVPERLRFRVELTVPYARKEPVVLRELRQPLLAARSPYEWVIE